MSETVENKAYSYTLEIQDGQNTHAEIISGYKSRKEKDEKIIVFKIKREQKFPFFVFELLTILCKKKSSSKLLFF